MSHQPDFKALDQRVYAKAVEYIQTKMLVPNGRAASEVEWYFKPLHDRSTVTLTDIYTQLLHSAQNKSEGQRSIRGVYGSGHSNADDKQSERWKKLQRALAEFDPRVVAERYPKSCTLFENIFQLARDLEQHGLSVFGKLEGYHVYLYAQSIITGAHFVASFASPNEFNALTSDQLIAQVEAQVHGFGLALACDFIKEIGYTDLGKPDSQLKDILREIYEGKREPSDKQCLAIIRRIAANAGVSAYQVDKVLWLIGSGNFYEEKHKELAAKFSRVDAPTRREKYIEMVLNSD